MDQHLRWTTEEGNVIQNLSSSLGSTNRCKFCNSDDTSDNQSQIYRSPRGIPDGILRPPAASQQDTVHTDCDADHCMCGN